MRNQAESPLLRLPAEIRNMIFSFALESAAFSVDHWYTAKDGKESVAFIRKGLYLPRVCRQIYYETKHLLDSYLFISIGAGGCPCAWQPALDRQGHHFRGVLEWRMTNATLESVEVGFFDNDDESHLTVVRPLFPAVKRVVYKNSSFTIDPAGMLRTLFDKPGLEVVRVPGSGQQAKRD